MILRSPEGQALFDAAVAAGDLVRGADHAPRDFDGFQPHQVHRKRAMAARLRGLAAAGRPIYTHAGLRLDALDSKDPDEEAGALRRARIGRFDDEVPEI